MSRLPADRSQTGLLRALAPIAGPFAVLAARSVPWSSATFDGAHHRLALRMEGEDAAARVDRLCVELPDVDLPIRGAFVAEIVVTTRLEDGAPVLAIEALTIEQADAPALVSRDARRAG